LVGPLKFIYSFIQVFDVIKFCSGNLNETDHLQNLYQEERISLRWILKDVGWESMDQNNPSEDRKQ
jgi:hypothetical protein